MPEMYKWYLEVKIKRAVISLALSESENKENAEIKIRKPNVWKSIWKATNGSSRDILSHKAKLCGRSLRYLRCIFVVPDKPVIICRVEYEKRVRRQAQQFAAEIVQRQMLDNWPGGYCKQYRSGPRLCSCTGSISMYPLEFVAVFWRILRCSPWGIFLCFVPVNS